MRWIRRGLALCLTMLLLLGSALAEVPFLQHTSGWTLEDTPLEALLSADVISCMPYDDDRLAMLRQVTDVLSMRLRTGMDEGSVTIFVGNTEAVTLAYLEDAVQLSCITELAFTSQDDPVDMLLGASTEVSTPYGLRADAETLLDDGWTLLLALEEPLEGYGKRKNVKTTITDMGLARTCTDYTVAAKDVETLKTMLLENCPEGWLREIISGLTFSGKQTLRVYRDENGVPLRMEYNGGCGPEGNLRTVKLIWRMRRDDVAHRDEVTLTSPAKSGTNKNTLEFNRVIRTNKQGALEMEGSFTYTVTADRQTTTRKGSFELTNAYTDDADVITGEITLQQKLPGEDSFSGLVLAPDMRLAGSADAPQFTGSVTVSTKDGSDVLDSAVIHITLTRCEASSWNEREESIDMDQLTPDELALLQEDVALGVATALVRPLILLLGDSAEWFFRDMLPEQIQRITDAADAVVMQ
ncbi:MAG: hypothetical protein IJE07_14870 [Clostridia bacterium]|nr:hypothetical protein [Clostridia bacterium]